MSQSSSEGSSYRDYPSFSSTYDPPDHRPITIPSPSPETSELEVFYQSPDRQRRRRPGSSASTGRNSRNSPRSPHTSRPGSAASNSSRRNRPASAASNGSNGSSSRRRVRGPLLKNIISMFWFRLDMHVINSFDIILLLFRPVPHCRFIILGTQSNSRNSTTCSRRAETPSSPAPQNLRGDPFRKSKIKTELCRNYMANGTCQYADQCNYAHGIDDLKFQTLLELDNGGVTDVEIYRTRACFTWVATGSW